jgi:hypothetical protein
MKLNQLVLLGVTSFLTSVVSLSGSSAGVLANPSFNPISSTSTSTSAKVAVAQNQTVAIRSGTFVAGEKPTTGTARIVTENGHRYLELDEAFSTSDQGPDLHVLLDTPEKPPQTYKNFGSYVNLGRLQKFSGVQRYPIPDAINPASFKSVVIWCRMANATFGYATLGRTNASSR